MLSIRADLLDEVVRHGLLQTVTPHEQMHRAGESRQVDGRLPGRVGGAHDVDLAVLAGGRLGQRGAVEDAPADEVVQARRVQPAVGDAGGQDHRVRGDLAAVLEPDHPRLPSTAPGWVTLARGQQLGAELQRLPARPVGELLAGDAVGEAQVVLDPGALARLPAGGVRLDQHGVEPFGGAVDRRAQPARARRRPRSGRRSRWPGWWTGPRPRPASDWSGDEHLALGGDHQRQAAVARPPPPRAARRSGSSASIHW